jgi:hypothetical protein
MKSRRLMASPAPRTTSGPKKKISHFLDRKLCRSLHPAGHPISALGQKQTSRSEIAMSALPPKADIAERDRNVRFVP